MIQQELLRRNDLPANVFLLLRHTGMRIGECVDLSSDCLHAGAPGQWAIHVPLGKMKTERLVPVDSFVCQLVQRLRSLRLLDPTPADGLLPLMSTPNSFHLARMSSLPKKPSCRKRSLPEASKKIWVGINLIL